ncbi:gamma-glutamyltransferase [Bremerella cremea]|uniref:Glutathione hydrolase proenzyme n=1 Tax=Bremerella cremea TaxID=1031537 RepID=A0A368KU93_9BACT|nr:gamma-glutamyltransferase [Bremerella cremea]RCS53891.1 gamma-glutamyltransferase [Bremerella cremea]
MTNYFQTLLPRRRAIVSLSLVCLTLLIIPVATLAQEANPRPPREPVKVATGKQGVVVTDTPFASEVGRDILAKGGNAVDAAVAVSIALQVSWPEAGNIGGGGFMMIAQPDEEVVCVSYREKAPAAVDEYSFDKWTDEHHVFMAGVPGTVRGLALAHEKYGKLPWKDLIEPSIVASRDGLKVDGYLAYSLNSVLLQDYIQKGERFAELRRVYGHPEGRPWRAGDTLVQPDLAVSLTLIAEEGPKAFYEGPIADKIVEEMKRGGGVMTKQDLKDYTAKVQTPVKADFGPYTIYGAAPPSSGGTTVLIQMQIIEALDFPTDQKEYWTAQQVHLLTEAIRRGFRERAAWLGDPDYVTIPEHLLTKEHAKKLAETIDPYKATPSTEIAGDIKLTDGPYESPQTTHFSVIDKDGVAVSSTYTLEGTFGCRIVVPGTGFLLNNEMGDFNWYPGYTNHEGKIGTKPNRLAPGKRMLSSMSPTIVLQDGKPKLLIGSPGGRTIINTVTEILVQTLVLNRSLEEAIDGPRFHHQWFPDEIRFEKLDDGVFTKIIPDLEARGYKVDPGRGRQGCAQGIIVDTETGVAKGVGDWRRGSSALAVE